VKEDCEREAGRKESGEEGEKFSVIPLSNRKKEGKKERKDGRIGLATIFQTHFQAWDDICPSVRNKIMAPPNLLSNRQLMS
jgi:hypothetical protein